MNRFLARHAANVTGVLAGFDRVVFHGVLQRLFRTLGMYYFLTDSGVRLVDYKEYVRKTTAAIKRAAEREASELARPLRYLPTSTARKEELARAILAERPVDEGLICTFTTLEGCRTFEYERSSDKSARGLKLYPSKCLHIYKYWIDPIFGFMSGRLQTWFPFNIQICINGREWLARQLASHPELEYKRHQNCFLWFSDVEAAQALMNEQLRTHWPAALDRIAHLLNPVHEEIFRKSPNTYYWTAYQTEWATDVMFRSPTALEQVYPHLVHFAITQFKSPDVMRFLADKAPGRYLGPIMSSFKDRAEGVRVKHWQGGNSIKMYDKGSSVLRVETTIGNPDEFKVLRPSMADPSNTTLRWMRLSKGVADLHRRAEISNRSNQNYLGRLADVDNITPCAKIFDTVSRPVIDRQRFRALRLNDAHDLALLDAISRGEFALAGFRNRDIRRLLYPPTTSSSDARHLSAKIGRLLRLLCAHKVICKIQHTTRYRLTAAGQRLVAALSATRSADISSLLRAAA